MIAKSPILTVAVLLLGACASSSNSGNGNASDASTDGGQSTLPCTTCRVFVSRDLTTGNLGGLQGADALCNQGAQKAGVGGTWAAWLADSSTAAIDRIHGDGPWYLMDKSTLAFPNHSALSVNSRAPINQDEDGAKYSPAYVWTGTNPFYPPTFCSDWTATTGKGTWVYAGDIYANISDDDCSMHHSLICFEQ